MQVKKVWKLLATVVLLWGTPGLVAALPTDFTNTPARDLGSCRIYGGYYNPELNNGEVLIFVKQGELYFPGGTSLVKGNLLSDSASITAAVVAGCLGLNDNDVSVANDPLEGTWTADTGYGFGFKLAATSGDFEANTFYTYGFGTSELTEPDDFASSGGPSLPILTAATQQLSSQIRSNQRLVRDSRDRLIESRRQMEGDGAGIASRNNVAFDVDGSFTALDGTLSTRGTFFEQAGTFEGNSRRLVFGDFDVQYDDETGSTTATLSGKVAWEHMLNADNMLGYFLGADLSYSDISGDYSGEQTTYGISAGAYFVSALQENLFLDGFLSVGAGRSDLELANSTVDLSGDYSSFTTTMGLSLSGVIEREGYEIRPEIALSYGYTDLGTISMTDRNAGSVDNLVTVDADSVSIANLTIRPEFIVPLDGVSASGSNSQFSFAPRLICEQVKTTTTQENCGGGAELGIISTSKDGLTEFNIRVLADRVGSSTRTGLELGFQHRF